ncbi:MAG: ORF6N domain-containing protein [Epsilonproteobacteria bacterium]|nr:ORF6N domain-containing protein [Campylobacterota bacterium]PIP10084.1 MAG: DNA-binding protein [Sulfurimonas sp. CG23_combo_of_CG06-09_8_20_14_all_36_33]PIS24903.1 MAG: DNA-binding protein [Sulfurimonas sp. CG08_land_8_20_14_0_20_36_33]PIU35663.1 MAG: DNA-binding protein [Sulfurimonas sp. CG07_land_8_20_14_0_80_36_56]PIV05136.1 MAG: DNA-binding protein [Sulfurimonas sp. CG03_land_8_20_14_0_80_36_25]PIV36483.1 MAG: DNA-binding protein [Sulfurimonas sp. CG02_land_8_20_14_3_00_36_67]PIV61589
MHEVSIINEESINSKIYSIRGFQVMLDRDLAELYAVKPIRLREQVKRNIDRFPNDFMFQLDDSEVDFMVSQNAIPSKQHLGGSLPYVFTEQGVASISGVLTNKIAIEINIKIMRAFVQMRKFIFQNATIFHRLESIETKHLEHKLESDKKFELLFTALENKELKPKQGIFYDEQIYDAYLFVSELIKNAKVSIVLIDNYCDESVLTLLSKRGIHVDAKIYTKNITKQLQLDLKKHNEQYPKIELKKFDSSHDRFLIIDGDTVYHIGASLKDLGKKWFAFSKFEMDALDILLKLEKQ